LLRGIFARKMSMQSVPNDSAPPALSGQPPSSAAIGLCDRLRLELISETMDLAASYASSASQAAWRGDRATLELHLKQTRLSLLTAIETFKALSASPSTNIGEAA
jgi:hypothetical protein